ncbi:hypothetical protein BpHYR1_033242 [Brachionus plicatilis]|uniref:Uncharacterized protein n=1 Tax=Brachionus plicatilis TaxID=10195 RepID=A0A3M7PGC0_BRAPC|nr:hypothetical protein BpHYR1_033242 [Brachionus plicatilis]
MQDSMPVVGKSTGLIILGIFFNWVYLFLNPVPKKMLVFHVKDLKTGFVEIVCQRTIAFFNFIGQFLILYSCPFFDYSDMSLKSSNYC